MASRRPKGRRLAGEPWTVHRILAAIEDEAERFATILTSPEGKRRCAPRRCDVLRGARQGSGSGVVAAVGVQYRARDV
ncbi:DUF6192 family protein [Streptomyces sp. NPDC021100]|uniref:DUF6192 family protein n=1 Tax=Streptomyces sp. NPDC021100 TaxID=3365114 RepID=UPI0037A58D09